MSEQAGTPQDPSEDGKVTEGQVQDGQVADGETPVEDENEPFNDVERAIVDGAEGRSSTNDVLSVIVGSPLFFLTAQEVQDTSQNVQPLILQGPDQQPVLALFTHPARVAPQFIESAPYAVSISGAEAIKQAGEFGVAINPGHPIGLVLDAQNVATVREVLEAN